MAQPIDLADPNGLWSNPYVDVSENDWFYDAVRFVTIGGLMNGTAADTFSPDTEMTRAMLVTTLHRREGAPDSDGANVFSDAAEGEWYTKAIIWAAANGVVNGYDDGTFGVNDPVTREQLVAILYRYSAGKGNGAGLAADWLSAANTGAEIDLSMYADAVEVSPWALDAVKWAVSAGLIQGRSETSLAPGGSSLRSEVAMILKRFYSIV